MKNIIQLLVALLCAFGTLVLLFLLGTSELNFLDTKFGMFYGLLGVLGGIAFIILTQKDDNEETNPVKEKLKK